jgi:hypothetical protein
VLSSGLRRLPNSSSNRHAIRTIMADVDMTDAPPAKAKASKASGEGASDGKKRFEVKKV